MDLLRAGRFLLVPASVIFALRALLMSMGDDPADIPGLGPVTGITGALALLGIVLAWWGARGTPLHDRVFWGLLAVLVGHFGLTRIIPDAGAAFVYAGTGLAAASPLGAWMGLLAFVGALARDLHPSAHLLVAVGSAGLAVALLRDHREE